MNVQLLVIAKAPVAGSSKTRLSPPFSLKEAARLAEAALLDTLAAVAATPAARRILVLDGEPGPWLPDGFALVPQRGRGLDERLAAAFADAGDAPGLLIGMDTPQVSPDLLLATVDLIEEGATDAVLGAAEDGGWWAIGLRVPNPEVFLGVPMSSPETVAHQRRRLRDLGMTWAEIAVLRDVDTAEDAYAVAARAPGTRFARALADIGGTV